MIDHYHHPREVAVDGQPLFIQLLRQSPGQLQRQHECLKRFRHTCHHSRESLGGDTTGASDASFSAVNLLLSSFPHQTAHRQSSSFQPSRQSQYSPVILSQPNVVPPIKSVPSSNVSPPSLALAATSSSAPSYIKMIKRTIANLCSML